MASLRQLHINSIHIKDHGHRKGLIAERRGLEALETFCQKYTFLHTARKATFEEDQIGIDLVLCSGDGIQYFQIKSSSSEARKWRRSERNVITRNFVKCIVIKPHMTKDTILYKFAKLILPWHAN